MESSWKELLARRLPELGHRNWIGVVDSAYPLQTAPGIEMAWTGADHFEVLGAVTAAVAAAPHVRGIFHIDAELDRLPVAHAPAAPAFRERLHPLLRGVEVVALPHEELIAKLDAAGQLFRVLLLKSSLTLPYTSVFLQLECGYWSAEAERALRAL